MLKKVMIIIMFVLFSINIVAIEECKQITEPSEIPCIITSTWDYSIPCTNHTATIYNSSGNVITNYTFQNFGITSRCFFVWNITELGSYTYDVDNGDTGNITIGNNNMMLAMVIGICAIIGIFLWIAFNLEEEHFFLKLLLILTSFNLLVLVPVLFITNDISLVLHKAMSRFYWIFWIYVFVYLGYKSLIWLGLVVPGKNKDGGY